MTDFDILIWGASGFTGKLVADYLDKTYGSSIRWAIGGRNKNKLEAVENNLQTSVPIVVAECDNIDSLRKIVSRAKVVASTVGPFAKLGTPLVQVCAESGVDYCDITGEPQWIASTIKTFQAPAKETGARIVHCCGFDSIPSDLGVLVLHRFMQEQFNQPLGRAKLYVRRLKGGASGGTIASMLHVLEEIKDPSIRRTIVNAYSLIPAGEKSGQDGTEQRGALFDPAVDAWTSPFIMAGINGKVVRRSNSIMNYPYGREFRYDEVMMQKSAFRAKRESSLLLGLTMLGVFSPTRSLLRLLAPKPGTGPNEKEREAGGFELIVLGQSQGANAKGAQVRVTGHTDPGYSGTAKMLGESALCLAFDSCPEEGGILTPAKAMGTKLVERLERAKIEFKSEAKTTTDLFYAGNRHQP